MIPLAPRGLRRTLIATWALSLVLAVPQALAQRPALVDGVDAVGITVSDMDRAVAFYSAVLTFEKVSDTEVAGDRYEHLEGVFGLRMRVVRMKLGDESIELTEYLAPRGRPIPVDSRSNDRWFQHIAIIVSDMDKVYAWLRRNKVEYASTEPQRLPDWNKNAAGISAFYFKDPDQHPVEVRPTSCFLALITPRSWLRIPMPASSSTATSWECASPGKAKITALNRNI